MRSRARRLAATSRGARRITVGDHSRTLFLNDQRAAAAAAPFPETSRDRAAVDGRTVEWTRSFAPLLSSVDRDGVYGFISQPLLRWLH